MRISEGKPYQRRDGRWVAPFHVDGRRNSSAYGATERKAKAVRREMLARVTAGGPVSDSRGLVPAYGERFIETSLAASDRKPSTRSLYARMLRVHVLPAFKDRQLGSIRGADIEALLLSLEDRLAPSSRRTLYAATRAMFETAVRDGLLAVNPVAAVRRPVVPHREAAHLEPDQLRALVTATADDRLAGLWLTLAGTGVRIGEALGLRWADVDLDEGLLRVRRTLGRVDGLGLVEDEPKSARSRRTITLGRQVVDVLKAHRVTQATERLAAGKAWQDEGRIFTTEVGTALDPRNLRRHFAALANRAGCPDATPHTLRHTAATQLLSNGHDLAAVSAHLGHSSSVVTLTVYSHVTSSSRRQVADALGESLG